MSKKITISIRDYVYDQAIQPLKKTGFNLSAHIESLIILNSQKENGQDTQIALIKQNLLELQRENQELRNKLNTRNALTEERIKLKEEKAAKDKAAAWAKMKHRSLVKSGILRELIK